MAYVIAEPCIATCANECTKVCPMDCIHGPVSVGQLEGIPAERRPEALRGLQMYIDPDECIDCGACAGVCPEEAVFEEDELPPAWRHYRELNARFSAARRREAGLRRA